MSEMIACISLHQPWASLIAARIKVHETRTWAYPTALEGKRIAIHAAVRAIDESELSYKLRQACRHAFNDVHWPYKLPRGCIVATATLGGARLTENTTPIGAMDRLAGNWVPGRWAWLLRDVRRLDIPLPWRGKQGWWHVPIEELGE